VLLVLASHLDDATGTIPDEYAPSFATLLAETGMSRSALAGHLRHAEKAKWLERDVPTRADARRHHTKTTYTLTVPEHVRETNQAGSGDEPAKVTPGSPDELDLVRETNQAGSGTVLELVRETDQASSSGEHRSDRGIDRSDPSPELLQTIADTIRARTGREITDDWAALVYRQILADRPGVRNPRRYVATVINREPHRFAPTRTEPNGNLPVPRVAPLGERDNPANSSGAAMARRLLADKAAN
jgi:hypothetical protein